jgi:hypothetical protein
MVMVRRLAGIERGEVIEMQYQHALGAARNGMVEILDEDGLPTTRVHQTDPLSDVDPAPKIEIIDERPREPEVARPVQAAPLPRQTARR